MNYWNTTANEKTFTHPFNMVLFESFVTRNAHIIDFGCGYGRIVELLNNMGFTNVHGYDTAEELIYRGHRNGVRNLSLVLSDHVLPVKDNSVDCFILFAVLTCIPGNAAQKNLLNEVFKKLKPGGIVYISDYYLQAASLEVKEYSSLNGDEANYGIFTLPDGMVFRHHTKEWIIQLTERFSIKKEYLTTVKTMNGNDAEAFQMIIEKASTI